MSDKLTDGDVSAIDKALAAAKQRKANREGTPSETTTEAAAKPAKAPKAPSAPKRPRLTDEEKAARETARAAERATKKAARETARAEKRAARDASRQPAHMRKVQKAADRLPSMSEALQLLFNEATALTAADISALALNLQHFNRVKATERALSQTIENGMSVRIVGGDTRYIGRTGTVAKAQRIRCYVTVPGVKKDVYLFTSDVEVVPAESAVAAG